jgi:hypothetical protein
VVRLRYMSSPSHFANVVAELIIANGPALREAQEKISAHVFKLLGLKL